MNRLVVNPGDAVTVLRACVLIVPLLSLVPPTAGAQDHQQDVRLAAAARDFFQQGLRFADRSAWADAADRFQRALTIRYSPVIAFNLASSLDELGRLVEASELLYRMDADRDGEAPLRQSAAALLADIRPRLASLIVRVPRSRSGAHVTLDGLPLVTVQLGAPFPIDPGEHELVLLGRERTLKREQFEVGVGKRAEVSLVAARVPSPAELAAQEMARRGDPPLVAQSPPLTERWWFWAGIGTTLATVVTVVTVAALSGDSQRAPIAAP